MSENPYYAASSTTQTAAPVRRFLRSRDDRVIAGVCGGAARYFGIDATLLRLLLVIAAILGVGTGVLVYLACWLLVPEEA
ncbi:MAG TPA: PspC domain-containing protein [Pseudonocardiaceae bacterium]|jgi:phage shock protein C|nr:PspC domain-containing protein [Pseudonocardiaceae bacterium]